MKKTIRQKFFSKIVVTPGCWEWTGFKVPTGYGRFYAYKKIHTAHRFSFIFYGGKIGLGMEIDHICRNRGCVNPDHLRAVSHAENMLYARKKFCKRGHEFSPENTGSGRTCKACAAAHGKEFRSKNKRYVAEYMVKWASENREKLRDYQREYMRLYRARKRARGA